MTIGESLLNSQAIPKNCPDTSLVSVSPLLGKFNHKGKTFISLSCINGNNPNATGICRDCVFNALLGKDSPIFEINKGRYTLDPQFKHF